MGRYRFGYRLWSRVLILLRCRRLGGRASDIGVMLTLVLVVSRGLLAVVLFRCLLGRVRGFRCSRRKLRRRIRGRYSLRIGLWLVRRLYRLIIVRVRLICCGGRSDLICRLMMLECARLLLWALLRRLLYLLLGFICLARGLCCRYPLGIIRIRWLLLFLRRWVLRGLMDGEYGADLLFCFLRFTRVLLCMGLLHGTRLFRRLLYTLLEL